MNNEMMPTVKVLEIMKTPIIGIKRKKTVYQVAKLMSDKKIGSVIVQDEFGEALGIVTERDIVTRVVAKKASYSTPVEEIMSSPIVHIDLDAEVEEAAKKMSRMKMRRLGVMEKDKLVGIITSRDIVSIMPTMVEVLRRARNTE